MFNHRHLRRVGSVALGALLLVVAAGCTGASESQTDARQTRNQARGSWNATTRFPAYANFQTAVSLTAELLKKTEPQYDPLTPLEKNGCTPMNRDGALINPSLSGCVYSDPAEGWVDYSAIKKDSDRAAAIKKNYLNYGHQYWAFVRNFNGRDLRGAGFISINLSGTAVFADPQMKGAAMGENASFAGAKFAGAQFMGARVGGSFIAADFRGFDVKSLGSLDNAQLDGANFSGTDLSQMTLPYSLIGTDLSKVKASGLRVTKALLLSSNLDEADLSGAQLTMATIGDGQALAKWPAGLSEWRSQGASAPFISTMRKANLSYADLSGANLQRVDLSGANLTGANLAGANLKGAKLKGTNLTGANLAGAQFDCGGACGTVNSELTNFTGAILDRANFSFSVGSDPIFMNVSAIGTNFSGARYSRADFSNADVSGANFTNSVIDGAKFANAIGRCTSNGYCTNFSGANLASTQSNFRSEFARYDGGSYLPRDADFTSANFSNANLGGVEFLGNFSDAIFICANVSGALFTFVANLSGAVFAGNDTSRWRMFAEPKPTVRDANCQAPVVLPSNYPKPVPTTVVTLPPSPTTTVATVATTPLVVKAIPGNACADPGKYIYQTTGTNAGSCVLGYVQIPETQSCPSGYGAGGVSNGMRDCYRLTEQSSSPQPTPTTTTTPLVVKAIPGNACADPGKYIYQTTGTNAGSCVLGYVQIPETQSCPSGYGAGGVSNGMRDCYRLAELSSTPSPWLKTTTTVSTKPVVVSALSGNKCADPNNYVYQRGGPLAGSCALAQVKIPQAQSCPSGYGRDSVSRKIRYCYPIGNL